MATRVKRLKRGQKDDNHCRVKRKRINALSSPLSRSTNLKAAFSTPVSRIINSDESSCKSDDSGRDSFHPSDGIMIKVPTKALGKTTLRKTYGQAFKTSFTPPCMKLPPTVPNVFSLSRRGGIELSRRDLYTEHLRVYGWEYKALLKLSEGHEYDSLPARKESDPMYPLVVSGIVPPLEKRRRQQTDWFEPQPRYWTLDNCSGRQPRLTPRRRAKLVQRIARLVDAFGYSSYTFHLAVTLMDKYLACARKPAGLGKGRVLDYSILRRLVCAWFWIAAKMEEVSVPSCSSFVSANLCTEEELLQNELDVCQTLQFRLHHVTPMHYAHEYLLASDASSGKRNAHMGPFLHDMLHYLLELSRFAHELVLRKPSLVAAGCLLLARATLKISGKSSSGGGSINAKDCWNETLEYYTGYTVEDLKDTARILHSYQEDAGSSEAKKASTLEAVFQKFSEAKYMSVSLEAFPNMETLFPAAKATMMKGAKDAILSLSIKRKGAANHEVISISSCDGDGTDHDVISTASSMADDKGSMPAKRKRTRHSRIKSPQVISLLDDDDDDV